MIRLYLLRHGQTSCNARADIVGGRSSEIPLTALGMEQAVTAGNVIRLPSLPVENVPSLSTGFLTRSVRLMSLWMEISVLNKTGDAMSGRAGRV